MSTVMPHHEPREVPPAVAAPAPAEVPPPVPAPPQPDLKVHMHSPLLFWWPVWVAGFIMALWTYLDGYRMVLVPPDAAVAAEQVTPPAGKPVYAIMGHVARTPVPGAVFLTVLLTVVIFGNIYLRGIWAMFAAACLVAFAFLMSWMKWWDNLFDSLRELRIYLNLGAYLMISITLMIVWLLAVFVFDRRTYLVFSSGQVRVRDEIGGEEKAFDTAAVAFEKRPFDWFRWLIGRGAGDLIVRIGGPKPQTIELTNVVCANRWLHALEHRLRTRDVE